MEKLINVENKWEYCVEHVKVEDPVSMIDLTRGGRDSFEAEERRAESRVDQLVLLLKC